MMVSPAAARALADIASRASDVMRSFSPGAIPLHHDSAAAGPTQFTNDPLTVAAPKNAYFITCGEGDRHMYTRDGQFHVHGATLVDRDNQPLMGFKKDGASLQPLSMDSVDVALHRVMDIRIEADGSITYARALVDPRTGSKHNARVALGRLALARFPAGSELRPYDATRGLAPPGVAPHMGRPGDGNFEYLVLHAREGSRLNFGDAVERLREAYLAFDALRSAQTMQGKLEKTTMDLVK
ncbi:MAG: hypothetical protein GIW98_01130 [Candidatus Eremiobacteraeota bacterium]|nr:hypothetical protein [Candidatus Eremiobacteraeota bacterium]